MDNVPDENDIVYQTYGLDIESLVRRLYEFVTGGNADAFVEWLAHWWDVYSVIAIILSILFFLGFVYARIRLQQLLDLEMEQLHAAEAAWAHAAGAAGTENTRWKRILNHIAGQSPNDWKAAIIDADSWLDEILQGAGYQGESLGERLKSANAASFRTLNDAWEAHKVRNHIAHAGEDFVLTQKIAKEAVTQYERVFQEFGVI